MSVLEIQVLGSPILREPTTPVAQVTDDVRRLLDDMFETMHAANGVGLAAPQVGVGVRLVVVEDRAEYQKGLTPEELAARERQPVDFHVLINPRLVVEDATPVEFLEGCLSVSGFSA